MEILAAEVTSSDHYSVHLNWSSSLLQFKYKLLCETERIYTVVQKIEGSIAEEDKWQIAYIGYGEHTVVMNLNPSQEYLFRIRFHRSDDNYSAWSPSTKAITEKEPYYGENLHDAVSQQKFQEIHDVLQSGNVKIDVPDNEGLSALMNTARQDQTEIMKILLSFNASVNAKDDSGKTALMHACIHGQLAAVKILVQNGALYEDFDLGGSAPLHYAVDSCDSDLIEWMIRNGADVNIQDKNAHWTPLMRCASLNGNKLIALTLIRNGADIDLRDIDGKTCLMIAVINGYQKLVDVLLDNNANIVIYNKNGHTAYELAMSLEKDSIIESLMKFMKKQKIECC
ncbi:fibronectin type 3 and ankyrin repeat domains protein 1 isoform X1 [Octopus bimaculoides]|uniref:Uncharacterized protein n=3 Tax=Octopus bimaculoides TaxID=37653 RepID=A0A0L8HU50_OCTBM|nr:fibronectin type 3 and ankyrin repeat domains protein 1 isoform X1 [Octopus bimaculoides]|eukprot:XP_014769356.1 PREDICTED: fibronectin type 3 and ankyrin repeat domains protein 1-like isoform X1 [Octopus bimaculoides]